MTIAILGAMDEEVAALVGRMTRVVETRRAGRRFVAGALFGRDVVVAFSGWGKVAAAATAARVLSLWDVEAVLFTGVAGALDPSLRIGDVVVGAALYQHDLDASPIFPPMQVPLTGKTAFETNAAWRSRLEAGARAFVSEDLSASREVLAEFGIGVERPPLVAVGDFATGDRFVSTAAERDAVRRRVPTAVCVEMEGAAVAQVCWDEGVAFGAVRVISDGADERAEVDFPRFLERVAGVFAVGVLGRALGSA